jgi:multidrug efflux pump subunit AcrB
VTIAGPEEVSFLRRTGGPPTTKPVSVKVRGDDPAELRRAADRLVGILSTIPAVTDIADDDTRGRMELSLRLNADTITRAGIDPVAVIRIVRLLGDGEVAASMQHQGEKVEVRVRAENREFHAIDSFLRNTVSLGRGSEIAIDHLLDSTTKQARANIRHYNLRRAITVEADLDKEQMDTIEVNRLIQREWAKHTASFPGVDLDFSGELDDIRESLNSIFVLFLFGIGLIYLILGTQFKSYLQPLYVLSSVPMAFTGVALGLFISGHPLSMYTLYGIVALAGIAVNDAIVLIATANNFLARGMSVRHAAVYAAKRRVVPVIITTLTTMAGLFSLAVGLGGKSLMWGPVATAIFWGLAFSTMLTLCMIPLLFASFTRVQSGEQERLPDPAPFPGAAWHPARLIRSLFATGKLVAANEQGLQELADDQTLSALYREGVDRLSDKRFDKAIRTFERMAGLSPDNAACNLYAAQALIMYMREHGWDVGYYARAQRYLARASRIAPDEQRLMVVQRAFEKLQPDTPAR